jgi:glyoxylase-like metal-dependent hydrolase (beta-lactamase superfamily II)
VSGTGLPLHRRRPGADAISPADGSPAVDLGDGIWMSSGLSNSYLLTSLDPDRPERVVINTGMGFEGPLHRAAFDAVDASPVRYVVLTQGHYDHVGGVDHFLEEGTDVVAHRNFCIWRADNERLEAFRSRNAAFAWMDAIVAAMEHARRATGATAAQSRPEPTVTFSERLELDVGGRELELLWTPGGETTDSLVVWWPGRRTLFCGNLFGPLFGHVPNLVTMRGDRYRDPLEHLAAIDLVRGLAPERLVTGHFDPIEGEELIAAELDRLHAATRHVHDRTVEGMNAGVDVHTLMREVRLPDGLDVGEGYGTVRWNVRAIWELYAGWFHHRSTTELYAVPPDAVAADLVAAAGEEALVAAARGHLADGRPVEALHLTDVVLAARPGHPGAVDVAVAAHEALLEDCDNFWERAWLRRAIDKLGGGA